LADFAGVSRSYVYDVVVCRCPASLDIIEKLSDALEVPASDLLKRPEVQPWQRPSPKKVAKAAPAGPRARSRDREA
jgi:hypothetical protein